jgi:uncharacterized protein YcbK (DUF882 family)
MTRLIEAPGISRLVSLSEPICKLSPNFTWAEATKDGRRIPPTETVTSNIIKIAKRMELVRARFGSRPVTITSWYRDPRSNSAAGGSSMSRHMMGDAVDFLIAGVSPSRIQAELDPDWDGGLGSYPTWTHLDARGYRVRWHE